MPVGRLSLRHALIGGASAGLLWEITRHVLVWYYGTISQVRVVYGSFATAIAVLLSVEIAAIVLLLGAQVIAEFERGASSGHAVAAEADEARRATLGAKPRDRLQRRIVDARRFSPSGSVVSGSPDSGSACAP
jgi:uncharacterized BrkB/YihY/UPF0761 family membrane protein